MNAIFAESHFTRLLMTPKNCAYSYCTIQPVFLPNEVRATAVRTKVMAFEDFATGICREKMPNVIFTCCQSPNMKLNHRFPPNLRGCFALSNDSPFMGWIYTRTYESIFICLNHKYWKTTRSHVEQLINEYSLLEMYCHGDSVVGVHSTKLRGQCGMKFLKIFQLWLDFPASF